MKKLKYSYIFVFSFCFMLLIYEPLMMYATNVDDFWFDLRFMIKPVILFFVLIFIFGCLSFTLIYFINRKFFKQIKIYEILLIISAICFFVLYIQGNYLIGNLPTLDGSIIKWTGYLKENIITIFVCLIVIISSLLMIKKLTLEKSIKILSYISLAICLMLSTSLISTLITNKAFASKGKSVSAYVTDKNINDISQNKNFLIFVLDTISEDSFYEVWQNNKEFKNLFDDFTYYNDAMSTYPFTKNSISFILTGKWNKNETDFINYSTNAYNESPLFKSLKERNYRMNIYESYLTWYGNRAYDVDNMETGENSNLNLFKFFKQEIKYVLFKYLPYNLKKYSKIEDMNFDYCLEMFNYDDSIAYENMIENQKLNKIDSNLFQFYHLEGGHPPFNVDKNFNNVTDGTYEQKIEACLTLIKTYLDRLKANNSYDNSVIIIMADHGYDPNGLLAKRFNPILMIKGINEKHEAIISDLPVSYDDLQNAYVDLLDNKVSTELFKNRNTDKTRKFISYYYENDNHMVEYVTTGISTDISKFKETGNVFDR